MIMIEAEIQMGEKTHTQDQLIRPVNLRVVKIASKQPVRPNEVLLLLFLMLVLSKQISSYYVVKDERAGMDGIKRQKR